ncbi:MAG: helix-turn-helix domain-containing protein [Gordonia sp. (in: high G+C Gram-positive bacteria)]
MTDDENAADTAVAVIRELRAQLPQIANIVRDALLAEISDLRGDAQLISLLGDSVEGNIDTIFTSIQHRIPQDGVTAPMAAMEYSRRLAQHDVSANALVRAYRLGQQELLRIALREIRSRHIDPEVALATFEYITNATARYIDWISEEVIEAYSVERERWRENRDHAVAEQVRTILAERDTASADALTTALRYPLIRHHLAVILWYPDSGTPTAGLTGMKQFVVAAADHLGASESPLFAAQDRMTGWAWIPFHQSTSHSAVATLRAFAARYPLAPSLAMGEPLPGVAGFRRSHELAEQARAVAVSGPETGIHIIASGDPGVMIAAMLQGGLSTADTWVREVLGPLASPNEADESLRETLRVFLECGSSFKDAATRLHLHPNTVKYRVRRATERRGRPLEDARLDVEIALLLCARFPAISGTRRT